MMTIDEVIGLLRPNIRNLKPYSSARDEYKGSEAIFLDANENPFNPPYNRYPDPHHAKLRQRLSEIKGVPPGQIFLGNGSDEPIDLVVRCFCIPGHDEVLMPYPTYGMYEVAAATNDIAVKKVLLTNDFQLDVPALLSALGPSTKVLFLCSPNNPTGNLLNTSDIMQLLEAFKGIVVIDEAYIDFARTRSFTNLIDQYPNVVVLQTLSKAWGLAGIRLGMAFGHEEVINIFYRVKYPYNLNVLTQQAGLDALGNPGRTAAWVDDIVHERERMAKSLRQLPVEKVFPSDANFLLVRLRNARGAYEYLTKQKIVTRDRSSIALCQDSLRITIGTAEENDAFLKELELFLQR